jgi:hypothetical protein
LSEQRLNDPEVVLDSACEVVLPLSFPNCEDHDVQRAVAAGIFFKGWRQRGGARRIALTIPTCIQRHYR